MAASPKPIQRQGATQVGTAGPQSAVPRDSPLPRTDATPLKTPTRALMSRRPIQPW